MKKIFLGLVVCLSLGFANSLEDDGFKAALSGDYEKALEIWQPLATQGEAKAQYNLGIMYEYGQGVKVNYEKAFEYYKLSADQGNMKAQYNLGVMYQMGLGVDQNDEKAFEYYKLSADQGYIKAQYNIALMYENGQGVEQDYKEALKYYKLSAEEGLMQSLINLSVGKGVDANRAKAYEYWIMIENQEEVNAQKALNTLCKESPWACK